MPQAKPKAKPAAKPTPEAVGEAMALESLARREKAAGRRLKALKKSAPQRGASRRRGEATAAAAPALRAAAPSAGVLIAEGDSWFDYPWGDILDKLDDDHGYDVETVANRGDTIEDMAFSKNQLDAFTRLLDKLIAQGRTPKAILLSGGGNDVIGDQFGVVLNHSKSLLPDFNAKIVEGLVRERVTDAYKVIIGAITKVCTERLNRTIPIIVHGYDYCVPDGRGFLWVGPWLEPAFKAKGYDDMERRKAMVRELIDGFNDVLAGIAQAFPHVRHLNLRETLLTDGTYKKYWDNETHPTDKGFKLVTAKFANLLSAL